MKLHSVVLPSLTSAEQALDVGYDEGCRLRRNGGKPEDLSAQRTITYEIPFPVERGVHCRHYASWRRGFDAGYLGQPKPAS